ncbi:hypothetical protein Slin15195_G001620 [Septoria linicola]|uniref:Peptidase C14 caspase domain-containing protein n=1 Tax=Septoria linicola TaxID=215465 RepID=A0A9Q9AIJ9_9PEZI|nr:hypothetical protein Slin14017_G001650 [Septoria linicola]USW46843.1 hypothetical protein Slin15195_G001620 [Septoria linicola]
MVREVLVETQDSQMRQHWDKVVCKQMGIPDTYQKVAVLMVRWDNMLDEDLKCEKEVEELEALFRQDFRYETRVAVLTNVKRPQAQLDSAVARFVEDYDGPHRSHLLIVYYTGHGMIYKASDQLIISGRQNREVAVGHDLYPPEARWEEAERSLISAESDVLTILDCCFAGGVMKGMNDHSRSWELLAACGKDTTPKPGPSSYTRHLIDSLRDILAQEDRRTNTFELNQMIFKKRNLDAKSLVFNRLHSRFHRHIFLAPLSKRKQCNPKPMARHAGHLNLRIAFEKHSQLTITEVTRLAENMTSAVTKAELDIRAIDWMGFEPYKGSEQFESFVKAVLLIRMAMRKWKNKLPARSRQKQKHKRLLEVADADAVSLPKRRHTTVGTFAEELVDMRYGPLSPGDSS